VGDADWVAAARELAARFAERAARHDRDASFPFENFADLREAGFLRLTVPREYGGYEAPLSLFLRTQEELAAGDGSTALALNMHQVRFGGERESHSLPPEWFEAMCRGAVEHGWLANTAATEEGLGSPAGGGVPATTATRTPDGWRIDGRKSFTTMAPALEFFIVSARIDEPEASSDPPEIGNFTLRPGDVGMSVVETWDSLGMRATGSHDLVLDGVALPVDRLLTRRRAGQADPRGGAGTAWFALGVAATTIGVAQAARDYAVGFARVRTPFGASPIRQVPGVRMRIGRIDLLLQRSRALVYDAARAWEEKLDDGMPPLDRVAVAKVETLNACIEATDLAMRVVGGVGLLKSRPIERYYRDIRAGLHNPPIEDRALEQLARRALDSEASPPGPTE
jgi:alkylation response protein AidB-like acyl-CoA dehydrogenase